MYEFNELNEKKKVLLDDFLGCCIEHDSLSDFLANNNIGWFFGVYQQKIKEFCMHFFGF